MALRKIWVKQPGCSASRVQVQEGDLVDDVRDIVLQKYAKSLGNQYDAPDINIFVVSKPTNSGNIGTEKLLRPDEDICNIIETFYEGNQAFEDALIIRPSTKPMISPRLRGNISKRDPAATGHYPPTPALTPSAPSQNGAVMQDAAASKARRTPTERSTRSNANANGFSPSTPGFVTGSRGTSKLRNKQKLQPRANIRGLSSIDDPMPPIKVLLVDDDNIVLRVLVRTMELLGVHWETARNGETAIDKWKTGEFHVVLMDIQMPVMDGLQATKEIRRLERQKGFNAGTDQPHSGQTDHQKGKLPLNNSASQHPVIIVALTASYLPSDRLDALAAGCNDFVTKPIKPLWLESKIRQWGYMQALIDFGDGGNLMFQN